MSNTETTTPTEDFNAAINACVNTLRAVIDNAVKEGVTNAVGRERVLAVVERDGFQRKLRVIAFLYGSKEEVRTPKNEALIKNILTAIGYTEADIAAWFEAVEVQFGYGTASSNQPVFAAA